MSVNVRIPTPLRKLTNELDVVSGDGGTLTSCIESLEQQYPGLKGGLCDETGGQPGCVVLWRAHANLRLARRLVTDRLPALSQRDMVRTLERAGLRVVREGRS